jgi:MFS family permease
LASDRTPRRSIVLFFFATVSFWTSMYVYMPVMAVHAEVNLGASMGLVGTLVGAYGFSQLVLRIPLGIWSDRIGVRKPFMLGGLVVAGLGSLGMGLTGDPEWMVFWRGIVGVGAAAWVAFTVLFSSYFPPERAAHAMSRIVFISGLSQMISTYAGGLIAQEWGWTAPFFVGAILAFLGLAAVLPMSEQPIRVGRQVTAREVVRITTVPLLLAVSIVAAVSSWNQWVTAYGFTPVYAERLGATRIDLGTLTAVMQLTYTVAALYSAALATRLGLRHVMVGGTVMQAVGALVVPFSGNLWLIAVSQVLVGTGRGISYPLLMGLSIQAVAASDRATAMGVFQAMYALGMWAGPATTGFLGDALGLSSVFIVAGVVTLAGVWIVMAKVPARV